jgi:hypothetical protein
MVEFLPIKIELYVPGWIVATWFAEDWKSHARFGQLEDAGGWGGGWIPFIGSSVAGTPPNGGHTPPANAVHVTLGLAQSFPTQAPDTERVLAETV